MRQFWESLKAVLPKTRFFWGLLIVLVLANRALWLGGNPAWVDLAVGTLLAICLASLFAQPQYVLLRGIYDDVYFLRNYGWRPPKVVLIANRKTFDALGFQWGSIINVSETFVSFALRLMGMDSLDITSGTLVKLSDPSQKSVYAILGNTRHGVPDTETLQKIWGSTPNIRKVTKEEANRFEPGSDLVSIKFWPK